MNKLTSTLFIFFLTFGITVYGQVAKVDSSTMVTLRIDPENAKGATVSQIFDEVEFIPLETIKESLFGSISQLSATKEHFVIYDYDTKSVLIFTKNGKFHAKINADLMKSEEDSKNENSFYGFQLVTSGTQEQIMTHTSKYVYYFDFNAKLLQKKLSKDVKYEQFNTFTNPDYLIKQGYLKTDGKDSTYHEIAIFNKDKEIAKYFPFSLDRYKNDQYMGSSKIYNSGNGNDFFYGRPYDFNIYKITPDKLSLAYRLIFPASVSLPADFMTNESYKNKRLEYFQKNDQIFYSLSDTYKIDNLLFLKMRSWGFDKNKKDALIYNLSTNEITSIKDIEPDSLSSFLPITDAGAFYDYQSRGMHLFKDQNFYTSYSSLAMFTFKEQSAGKKPHYNAVLSNYFKTQNKKSNPVLIRLKPKKN